MKPQTNYLAIFACVVMHAVLGALWFSAIFGSQWMEMNHMPANAQMSGGATPYLYSIFMSLMMALLMSWLSGRLNIKTIMDGARLGFMVAFSTFLVGFATNYRFSGRPMRLALIDGLYPVVSMILMGAIIGGWRTKAQKVADLQRA